MKLWSQLAAATKAKYARKGVKPQRYNAWIKSSTKTRADLTKRGISRDEFLTAPSTRDVKRAATIRAVIAHMIAVLPRPSVKAITRNVNLMTPAELNLARRAGVDKLRRLASEQRPVDRDPDDGTPLNHFWYH